MIDKISAYLHEIADDISAASDVTTELQIKKIAIRQYWSKYAHKFSTNELYELERRYKDNILLLSLPLDSYDVDLLYRYFGLCQQLSVPYLQFGVGNRSINGVDLSNWLGVVSEYGLRYSVTPVFEISSNVPMNKAIGIVMILNQFKNIRIVYDPAQFVLMGCLDHFFKYWSLLHKYVSILEVRDYKLTRGPKPPGFGDGDLLKLLKSAGDVWYLIETGLGSRYQMVSGKVNIFRTCYFALKDLHFRSLEVHNARRY